MKAYSKLEMKVRRLEREMNSATIVWDEAVNAGVRARAHYLTVRGKYALAQMELEQERKAGEYVDDGADNGI